MSDIQNDIPVGEDDVVEVPAEQAEGTDTPAEEKPAKLPKAKSTGRCLCQAYEVVDRNDADTAFTTGCDRETGSTFAQGHDARLVSFLVDGYFDGYQIRQVTQAGPVDHATPADAVADVSNALQTKAEKATANRRVKIEATEKRLAAKQELAEKRAAEKAEREAAKAAAKAAQKAGAPKPVNAEVVADSVEGDATPLAPGEVKIKVGRWSYNATIDDAGAATYVDGSGSVQTKASGEYAIV